MIKIEPRNCQNPRGLIKTRGSLSAKVYCATVIVIVLNDQNHDSQKTLAPKITVS